MGRPLLKLPGETDRVLNSKKGGRPKLSRELQKFRKVRHALTQIIEALSDKEPEADSLDLHSTAGRLAEALVYRCLAYPDMDKQDIVPFGVTDTVSCTMVQGPLPFSSICCRHLLPFRGDVYIGILPDELLFEHSDYSKIITCVSQRFQYQEKLGGDLLSYILDELSPLVCSIRIICNHPCSLCKTSRPVTSHIWPTGPDARPVIEEIAQMMAANQRQDQ